MCNSFILKHFKSTRSFKLNDHLITKLKYNMKIVILIDNMKFSGGRKVFFEYATYLKNSGHDVSILTLNKRGEFSNSVNATQVNSFAPKNIPYTDILLATTPREVKSAYKSKKGKVVHFCQGYEIEDLEERVAGNILPERYHECIERGLSGKLKLLKKKFYWKRKRNYFNSIYKLNTNLITVSKHLKTILEERYKRPVHLCRNGIHTNFFHPDKNWHFEEFTKQNPCRIINIGPLKVTVKGIPDTLQAIKKAKSKGLPINFIRVTPHKTEITALEKEIADEYYTSLSSEELSDLMKKCDVYISNSLEGEGFGLPAMEALGCGLVPILSNISSYKNFSDKKNYCIFVDEHAPEKTYQALEKIIRLNKDDFEKIRMNAVEISKEYTFAKACTQFENILKSILLSTDNSKQHS
jgi:glycosyltransferase involved in cell wall biosynthesis